MDSWYGKHEKKKKKKKKSDKERYDEWGIDTHNPIRLFFFSPDTCRGVRVSGQQYDHLEPRPAKGGGGFYGEGGLLHEY